MYLNRKQMIDKVACATCVEEIHEMVQAAITLEFATLPTYFTGVFSIKPGYNLEAKALIGSVALEEMLHMTLASNLMIAIRGKPDILGTAKALKFPTPLPLNVDEGLVVSLNSVSKDQVKNVFMEIERPDTDAKLPSELVGSRPHDDDGYYSIGDFYDAILKKLEELPGVFDKGSVKRQVDISQYFPPVYYKDANGKRCLLKTGKVSDIKSAKAAVAAILDQGEGAMVESDPIDPTGGLGGSFAHYFKFAEIYYGRRLVRDDDALSGWSYTGEEVPLETDGVYEFKANPAMSDYTEGTGAYVTGQAFYDCFMRLVTALEEVFNGSPDDLGSALGLMYELKLLAHKVVQFPADPDDPEGPRAAPPFQLEKNCNG